MRHARGRFLSQLFAHPHCADPKAKPEENEPVTKVERGRWTWNWKTWDSGLGDVEREDVGTRGRETGQRWYSGTQ